MNRRGTIGFNTLPNDLPSYSHIPMVVGVDAFFGPNFHAEMCPGGCAGADGRRGPENRLSSAVVSENDILSTKIIIIMIIIIHIYIQMYGYITN